MDPVNQSEDASLNIQNDYFNKARKGHTRITVVLTNGQRISGFIRSFDKFTLILDTRNGDQMIFKHAISTVSPSSAGDRDGRGPRPRRPHPGDRGEHRHGGGPGRHGPPRPPGAGGPPREGDSAASGPNVRQRVVSGPQGKAFGNYMDLSAVSKGSGTPPPGPSQKPPKTPEPSPKPGPSTASPPPEAPETPPKAEGTDAPPAPAPPEPAGERPPKAGSSCAVPPASATGEEAPPKEAPPKEAPPEEPPDEGGDAGKA